jgi:hypothetical protein
VKRAASIALAGLASGVLTVLACGRENVVVATIADAGRICGSDAGGCDDGSFCSWDISCDRGIGHCELIADYAQCSGPYEPECGCLGVTYYNECVRRSAQDGVSHPGVCEINVPAAAKTCTAVSDCPDAGGIVCSTFLDSYIALTPKLPGSLGDAGLVTIDPNGFGMLFCSSLAQSVPSFIGKPQCWVLPQEDAGTSSTVYDVCQSLPGPENLLGTAKCIDRATAIRGVGLYLDCPFGADASAD